MHEDAVGPLALHAASVGKGEDAVSVAPAAPEFSDVDVAFWHALDGSSVCLTVAKLSSADDAGGQAKLADAAGQALFIDVTDVVRAAGILEHGHDKRSKK